ncbi:MFS transporter [Microvirga sp. HBU67558]|uniref:MFS transporter n=1 Tax=Microvirga TaxID=186650 RepID=UPI001B35B703|nr:MULTISPECIES: MFS transporter [unclassified Microvirga]MBQ0819969.1 MFS transporter [Microvirga sp. HBU67558]
MLSRFLNRELWEIREFRAFVAANTVERFAASALTVMLAFHIYEIRKDPLDIALLGFVQVIPGLTIALHGGEIADRHSRRKLVLITVGLLTLLCAGLALVSAAQFWLLVMLLASAFLSASIRSYQAPAAVGLEAQVLPVGLILKGIPIISTSGRIADMLGPVAVGFIWAAAGPVVTYGVLAALFAASYLIFAGWIGEKPIPVHQGSEQGPVSRIYEGIQYVFRNQVLIGSMALDLFAVFFGGAAALLPIFATDILQVGPSGFGMLRAAIAAGALTAALMSIRLMPKASAGLALHLIIAGFGMCMVAFGLSTNFYLSLLALFLAGICDGFSMVIRHAILRLASPEHMRGRIAAVRMVFVSSSNELGAMQMGLSASLLGPTRAVVAGGLLTLGVVAAVAWRTPMLRRLDLGTFGIYQTSAAK